MDEKPKGCDLIYEMQTAATKYMLSGEKAHMTDYMQKADALYRYVIELETEVLRLRMWDGEHTLVNK